jgi:predicted ATPase
MRLRRAQIIGFQSFSDSGSVLFDDGINLIVGQNNAGKSAFLRALQPVIPDDRHRTPIQYLDHLLAPPEVRMSLEVSGAELLDAAIRNGGQCSLPVFATDVNSAKIEIDVLFTTSLITLDLYRRPNGGFESPLNKFYSNLPSNFGHTAIVQQTHNAYSVVQLQTGASSNVPNLVQQLWHRDMFFFSAERFAVGQSPHNHVERLESNAANLPAVLHTLSGSRGTVFQKLVQHLRDIFPTIGNLSVRPLPGAANINEIRVWPTQDMSRVELSFPLNQSGTGVAQAVAILVAIMTIDKAIIMIDEINSFLHPSAIKSLLRIIQSHYSHHQYIISTHSAEVISFGNPCTVHLVNRLGYESTIKQLNLIEVEAFREVADHLGISMSDVFAAERIVWVEGPTEELCFPYLCDALLGGVPRGLSFTSVASTGDFNRRRDPQIVYEIYRRLSTASGSLVVSTAFSFDTERLTDVEKEKMKRESKGLLRFLPRRNFECYLIDEGAIALFIASKDSELKLDAEIVAEQLRITARDLDLSTPHDWDGNICDENWLTAVDGANLIKRTCAIMSDNRVTFSKRHDSLQLLKYIIANNPERLASLKCYIRELVGA